MNFPPSVQCLWLGVFLASVTPVGAHEHLAAGAALPEPDAALLFVNAGNFAAESGYVVTLKPTPGTSSAHAFQGELTFVCLAATPDLGGPVPFHPALGSRVEAVVESAEGPDGGEFGFWESTEGTGLPPSLTFAIPVGTTNGVHRLPVSENDGSPGADPYGHVHGRVFSATLPGLYRIGLRFVDTSTNGRNGGPLHTPSPRFHLYFQAGLTLGSLNETPEGIQLTYATQSGFNYHVEAATGLSGTWSPVTPVEPGNDHLTTVTIPTTSDPVRYFRLRRESE